MPRRRSTRAAAARCWCSCAGRRRAAARRPVRRGPAQHPVRQCRQLPAHLRNSIRIDVTHHDARPLLPQRDDLTPWVDEHRMAPGPAAIGVQPALRSSEDVALVLDGARAQQQLPVRSTGRRRERGRHEDQRALAEPAVELGEAHVVADRQADPPARRRTRPAHRPARSCAFRRSARRRARTRTGGSCRSARCARRPDRRPGRRCARGPGRRRPSARVPPTSRCRALSRAVRDRRPAAARRRRCSRAASLSVARAPRMPKYSGSTTSRAPPPPPRPISGAACARFSATSPPDIVCTAATRNAAGAIAVRSSRGRLGVPGATLAVAVTPCSA